MGLKIKVDGQEKETQFTRDAKEWAEQMPKEIFDPTNDKSNKDNHGWRNSDFTKTMDNDT